MANAVGWADEGLKGHMPPGWGKQQGWSVMYSPEGTPAPHELVNMDIGSGAIYDRGRMAPPEGRTLSLVPGNYQPQPRTMAPQVGAGDDGPVGYGDSAEELLSGADDGDPKVSTGAPAAGQPASPAAPATGDQQVTTAPGWPEDVNPEGKWLLDPVSGNKVMFAIKDGKHVGIMYVNTQAFGPNEQDQAQAVLKEPAKPPKKPSEAWINKSTLPNKTEIGEDPQSHKWYYRTPQGKVGEWDASKGQPAGGGSSGQDFGQGKQGGDHDSPVLSAIRATTDDPRVQLAMGVGAAMEGGLGSHFNAGDSGMSWGPFQINHNKGMHSNIDRASSEDPAKAAQYMLDEYRGAVGKVPAELWKANPKAAAAQAAFLAERPAQMYPQARVDAAYDQVTGSGGWSDSGGGASPSGSGGSGGAAGGDSGNHPAGSYPIEYTDANGQTHVHWVSPDRLHYGNDSKGQYSYDPNTGEKTYISDAGPSANVLSAGDSLVNIGGTAENPTATSIYRAPPTYSSDTFAGGLYNFNPQTGKHVLESQGPYNVGDQLFVPQNMVGQFGASNLPANLKAGSNQLASELGMPGTGDDDEGNPFFGPSTANQREDRVSMGPSYPDGQGERDGRFRPPVINPNDMNDPGVMRQPMMRIPEGTPWTATSASGNGAWGQATGVGEDDPQDMDPSDFTAVGQGNQPAPPVAPQAVEGMGTKPGEVGLLGHAHQGIDVQAQKGTPVMAPEDGVIHVERHETGGLVVYVVGTSGRRYKMAHLDAASVQEGQQVKRGQPIASVGESGTAATGPNLHFEMQNPDGSQRNPREALGRMADMPMSPNTVGQGEDRAFALARRPQPSAPPQGFGMQPMQRPQVGWGDAYTGSEKHLEDSASDAATSAGIDPALFYRQIRQESGFDPRARNAVGAQGIAQFMPGTARELGVDPFSPGRALNAAAQLDRTNLDRFGGDYPQAMAAYNAGPGAVAKFGGVPPYPETQNYVKNIVGRGDVGWGADDFGQGGSVTPAQAAAYQQTTALNQPGQPGYTAPTLGTANPLGTAGAGQPNNSTAGGGNLGFNLSPTLSQAQQLQYQLEQQRLQAQINESLGYFGKNPTLASDQTAGQFGGPDNPFGNQPTLQGATAIGSFMGQPTTDTESLFGWSGQTYNTPWGNMTGSDILTMPAAQQQKFVDWANGVTGQSAGPTGTPAQLSQATQAALGNIMSVPGVIGQKRATVQEQAMYQAQLQSALNNPWLTQLTGMAPGMGLGQNPGFGQQAYHGQQFGQTAGGPNPIVGQVAGAPVVGGGDDAIEGEWTTGPSRRVGWGDAPTQGQAAGSISTMDRVGPNGKVVSAGSPWPGADAAAGSTSTSGGTPAAGAGQGGSLGFQTALSAASPGPGSATAQNAGSMTGVAGQLPNLGMNMVDIPSGLNVNERPTQAVSWKAGQKIYTDGQGYMFIEQPTPSGADWAPTGMKSPFPPATFNFATSDGSAAPPSGPSTLGWSDWQNLDPFKQAAWLTQNEAFGFGQPQVMQAEQQALAQQGVTAPPDVTQMTYGTLSPLQQMAYGNTAQIFGQTPQQWLAQQQKNWSAGQAAPVGGGVGWA